jgi:hypothetical protein
MPNDLSESGCIFHKSLNPRVRIRVTHECTRALPYCRHIRALESPESSEFMIQSGALIEKVRFLSRRPDICIFNLKSNFASGDWLSATPQMMKMRNKQLTGGLVNPVPPQQMRWR